MARTAPSESSVAFADIDETASPAGAGDSGFASRGRAAEAGDDRTTPSGADRVLNQDEIDSLLGFGDDAAGGEASGIHAVLNRPAVSYERLPMLDVVFERLVRLMTTSLRHFTAETVDVSIEQVRTIRFGEILDARPTPAAFAVVRAEEWNNHALIRVEPSLAFAVVEALLGGRPDRPQAGIDARPATTIERSLVERMVRVVLGDLSAAFQPLSPVTFRVERVETDPRFAAITRPSEAAVAVRLKIDVQDRGGRLDLVIPYATLEPVRGLLLQMVMGEKFGRDPIWESHLAESLRATRVELCAVLDECIAPLAEIMGLKVGSRIVFNATPDTPVEVRCGGVPMFTAATGRRGGHLAVQIEHRINARKRDR